MADYANGRLFAQVIPMLHDDDVWRHPLIAATFGDELRDRLRAAAAEVPAYIEEVLALPHTAAHGDACPNNLLATTDSPDFTLIDYGFWMPMPVGADLSQLLIGDVQIGKARAPATSPLATTPTWRRTSRAFATRAATIPEPAVRRAHALQMLMMSGLSALPVELLDQPPSPALEAQVADRAAIARFCLDRVADTAVS